MVKRRFRIIFLFILFSVFLIFSGFNRTVKYNTGKKILVSYAEIPPEGREEVIDYLLEKTESSLRKMEHIICTRFYLDELLEKKDIEKGENIPLELLIESGEKSKADIVIFTEIKKYSAHRTLKPGIALYEPITMNTSILNRISIITYFVDIEKKEIVKKIEVNKEKKNRLLGLFTLKRYLLHRTLRECLGQTLYIAEKSEVI